MMASMERESDRARDDVGATSILDRGFPAGLRAYVFGTMAFAFAMAGAGFVWATIEDGRSFDERSTGIVATFSLIAALFAYMTWRAAQDMRSEGPISARTRNARLLLISGLPLLIAFMFLMTPEEVSQLMRTGELSSSAAWLATAFVAIMAVISVMWLRTIDEHERKAHDVATVWAFYAFASIAPAWWWLGRAGVTPPLDPVALYLGTMMLFSLVWLRHRDFA